MKEWSQLYCICWIIINCLKPLMLKFISRPFSVTATLRPKFSPTAQIYASALSMRLWNLKMIRLIFRKSQPEEKNQGKGDLPPWNLYRKSYMQYVCASYIQVAVTTRQIALPRTRQLNNLGSNMLSNYWQKWFMIVSRAARAPRVYIQAKVSLQQ